MALGLIYAMPQRCVSVPPACVSARLFVFGIRVNRSTLLWRVPVSEDGELSSPQRRFFLHYSRHSHMHVTGEGWWGLMVDYHR